MKVEEPKPTYRAIFGAYWSRFAGFVELWWFGFGLVQICLVVAIFVSRNPASVPSVGQQPVVTGSVVLAVVVFVVTFYHEFV